MTARLELLDFMTKRGHSRNSDRNATSTGPSQDTTDVKSRLAADTGRRRTGGVSVKQDTADVKPRLAADTGQRRSGGVSVKQGGYIARICLAPNVYAASRCQQTHDDAWQCLTALRRAQRLVAKFEASEVQSDRILDALEQACKDEGVDAKQVDPSFCACVNAHAVVGRLVAGGYSTDLAAVIEQRNLLLAARGADWAQFRSAWITVMQSPATQRAARAWGGGGAKPRPTASKDAERVADAARHATLERQRRLLEQRLARITKVVLSALRGRSVWLGKRRRDDSASFLQAKPSATGAEGHFAPVDAQSRHQRARLV